MLKSLKDFPTAWRDLPLVELREFIGHYDSYIQDANDKDSFLDGWRPVCLQEFYSNEYADILACRFES